MNRLIYILVAAIMLTLPGFTAPKTANANPNIQLVSGYYYGGHRNYRRNYGHRNYRRNYGHRRSYGYNRGYRNHGYRRYNNRRNYGYRNHGYRNNGYRRHYR